jgi:hypothetical protein
MTCCCVSVVHKAEIVDAVTVRNCWRIGQREVQADGILIPAWARAGGTVQLVFQ